MVSRPSPTMIGVIGVSLAGVFTPPILKPELAELLLQVAGVLPELLDALRLLLEDVEGGDAGRGDGRRMRGREQERPRAMIEKLDQVARAADVAAERADGLRERADLDIDAAMQVEVVDGAAAVAAQHARGVRVVDHHDRAIFLGQRAKAGQRADVAVHGEDAVGDEQLAAGLVLDRSSCSSAWVSVLVAENLDLGTREPAPSMMLAWFNSSEMMKSSLPSSAETVPAFAVNPD